MVTEKNPTAAMSSEDLLQRGLCFEKVTFDNSMYPKGTRVTFGPVLTATQRPVRGKCYYVETLTQGVVFGKLTEVTAFGLYVFRPTNKRFKTRKFVGRSEIMSIAPLVGYWKPV